MTPTETIEAVERIDPAAAEVLRAVMADDQAERDLARAIQQAPEKARPRLFNRAHQTARRLKLAIQAWLP